MARFLAHRHFSALMLSVVLVVFMAAPAVAGGTVDCGAAGHLYTWGKSTVNQTHWVDDYGESGPWGAGTYQIYWGLKSGSHLWDVYGVGVYYEASHCPI